MGSSKHSAEYESALARAHKAVYDAGVIADLRQDYGAAEDLFFINQHLSVLLADSLAGRKRKHGRAQLTLDLCTGESH